MDNNIIDLYKIQFFLVTILFCSLCDVKADCPDDSICLGKRVAIEVERDLPIITAHAISAVFHNNAPATVQLWTLDNVTMATYTLVWQQKIQGSGYFGMNIVPINPPIQITSDHYLGVFFEDDPGPFRLSVVEEIPSKYAMMLSDKQFLSAAQPPPVVNNTYSFKQSLRLPYSFLEIEFCNTSDCTGVEQQSTTLPSKGDSQSQFGEPTEAGVKQEKEESQFLNDEFLLGLMVWLIIVSFILLAIILLLCCIYLRPKQDPPQQSSGEVEPEWYVVVDDQNKQLQQPSTSYAAP